MNINDRLNNLNRVTDNLKQAVQAEKKRATLRELARDFGELRDENGVTKIQKMFERQFELVNHVDADVSQRALNASFKLLGAEDEASESSAPAQVAPTAIQIVINGVEPKSACNNG